MDFSYKLDEVLISAKGISFKGKIQPIYSSVQIPIIGILKVINDSLSIPIVIQDIFKDLDQE